VQVAFFAVLVLLVTVASCYAAEGFTLTRELWQRIMRWVNFGIIVVVFWKYGKDPLVNFLRGRQQEYASELHEVASEEKSAREKQQDQIDRLENIDQEEARIKEYYRELGRQEKERIIQSANEFAERLVEDAKKAAEAEFAAAKKQFREEVIEKAVELAENRIRKQISQDDHQKLIDAYLKGLKQAESASSTG
jgi:F-type H+-transporting ATPase subunit b